MRAYTNMDETARDLAQRLELIRNTLNLEDGTELDEAVASVETFCAVALRVMRKTNPSKVRSEARTVEIKARMDGVLVLRGAA